MSQTDRPPTWTGLEELRPLLLRFATRRCRDAAQAEDVVQEALLRAARYRPDLADAGRLEAWVLRIAANVHRDWMRREGRYVRTEQHEEWLDTLASEEPDATSGFVAEGHSLGGRTVEMDVALGHLPAAIGELKPADRDVLECFYQGNQSCQDLARRYSISRSLAKVRVFRARRRLTRVLRRRMSLEGAPNLAGRA